MITNQIPTQAAMRLTGTNAELKLCLSALLDKGFTWKSNGRYYPQRGEGNKYAYYLNDLQLPQLGATVPPPTPGEPQPRPWDAVLGGQGENHP